MSTSKKWQLQRDAAERYEQILVPAILGPFARALVEAANLQPGEAVMDVGCGTGAAARFAAEHVGPSGRVIGVDVNVGMIEVAKSLSAVDGASIEWFENTAYQLPLPDQSMDIVLCAQTLQFLNDRPKALSEMYRMLKRGGRVAVSLWCPIKESPYFHNLIEAVAQHIGRDTADGLGAAFALSNSDNILSLLTAAGFENVEMTRKQIDLDLPHLIEFVPRHISATPMVTGFNAAEEAVQNRVINDMVERLAHFKASGGVQIPFRSYLALGYK